MTRGTSLRRRTVLGLILVAALPGVVSAQGPGAVTSLTLFAGTPDGLWRSSDWGGTWSRVVGAPSGASIEALGAARAVLPRGPEVYVAGDSGLYLSTDFGDAWTLLSETAGARALLISRWPQADPTMFVGTGSGLLRSRDGGQTFSPTALTGSVDRLDWPGGAVVAAGSAGLLVTRDEGETVEGPGRGLPPGPVRAFVVSSYFAADPVIFASPEEGGLYRSGDGGATWATVGLAGARVADLVWLGPFLYAAADTGFFRSDDAGGSWTRLSDSPGEPRRLVFPLAPAAGLEAFLATASGVFYTADAGAHWRPAGLVGQDVLTIATFPPPDPITGKKKRR
jgi:photosystem II stability/assembly factor-like uncharacterized protein